MCICDIRGWGYLTGIGGLHLSEAEAVEIQRANTRLIVAAPDLLAALKYLDRKGGLGLDVHAMISAAIAKAEGGASSPEGDA